MKKRLFIAIDISDDARNAAADYINDISKHLSGSSVKWERPQKLHITVKFLGNTEEALMKSLKDMLDNNAKATRAFEIQLVGTGAFPNATRPRVLWLGVRQASEEFADLASRIDTDASKLGFESENKSFSPHLTIARVRNPHNSRELGVEHASKTFGPISFTSCELAMYESHLSAAGSSHTKIHVAKFEA